MSTLSPAAQAVIDAAAKAYWKPDEMCPADPDDIAAAALRAAVEQVLPQEGNGFDQGDTLIALAKRDERSRLRLEFLAIATELENAS